MNDITTARMLLATAALAAVAALFAGGANAMPIDVDGTANGAAATPPGQQPTVPYLSHGTGVDASLWNGDSETQLTGVHAALQRDRTTSSAGTGTIPYLSHGVGVDESLFGGRERDAQASSSVESGTIPYLSQGTGVDANQFAGRASLGLTGDTGLTRAVATEPVGLSGDSAVTRYPGQIAEPVAAGSEALDWTSFGAGAGMAALIAVASSGVWLTTRRRRVALP